MALTGHQLFIPRPGQGATVTVHTTAALAYLGDSIYELFIRSLLLEPPRRIRDYHHLVVQHVKAESQSQYLEKLLQYLTPDELDILRQGRNAASTGPKRVSAQIYQQATSLETLLGHLYIADPERLTEILLLLQSEILAQAIP